MKGLLINKVNPLFSLKFEEKQIQITQVNNTIKQLITDRSYTAKLSDESPIDCYSNILIQIPKTFARQNCEENNIKPFSFWYRCNRQHCVSYINKLCDRFNLKEITYYSALSYCDTIMRNANLLTRRDLDLKVIGCFLLAAKFAENDAYELDISGVRSYDLSTSYDRRSTKENEVLCLKELDYRLNHSTINDVLKAQIVCGVIEQDEITNINQINSFYSITQKYLKQISESNISLMYDEEVITFCIILLGRNYLNLSDDKNRVNEIKSKLEFDKEQQFESCYKEVKEFFNRTTTRNSDSSIRSSFCKMNPVIKAKSAIGKPILNKISNNIIMRNTVRSQVAKKMTLALLSSNTTNQTKCSNTSCSTKQDSSSTLNNVNFKDRLIIFNKTRSVSTKPNLSLKIKQKLNLSLKCKLPIIEAAAKRKIEFIKKTLYKGL